MQVVAAASVALAAIAATPPSGAEAQVSPVAPPETTVLLDSGAWSWFEDERVVIDAAGTRLYVSAVADAPTPGEVVVGEVDMATGARGIASLGAAEMDDHNSAAMWESPVGEVVAAWSRHSADTVITTHRRRTDGSWLRLPPVTADSSRVTYNNLYSVLAEDGGEMLFDFYRGARFDPQAMASTDAGRTWSRLGTVLRDPADSTTTRPYVRYASRGDRIDLIATEAHPGAAATSIYHGFILGGIVHTSFGEPLGPVGSGVPVTALTRIAAPAPAAASWTVDIGYDPATGHPIAAYSTTISVDDHRYHVARWDGATWQRQEIAFAGRALYAVESHYTGLVALDPTDGNRVVISTDVDPVTGAPLVSGTDGRRHYELFDGRRQPNGTYAWSPLTANSTQDNIRPVITANGSGAWALAWMRGRYTTYRDYALEIVGVVRRPDGTPVTTAPTSSRLPVVPGIAAPAVLPTAGVPIAGDFDPHGADDVYLYRPGSGRDDLIIGDDGRYPVHAAAPAVRGTYRPIAGDYDGDGDTDILWYAPGTAADHLWTADGDTTFTSRPLSITGSYRPVAGDYDGDGATDILWYAPGTAADHLWTANGDTTFTSRATAPINGTYTPVPGDYDANGADDILWYAPGTAADHLWTANGDTTFTSRATAPINGTYTPVPGDYDANGADDILWYAPGTAADRLWTANGDTTFTSRVTAPVNGTYRPVAGDYDANGADDILWYAPGTASDHVWWSGPTAFALSQHWPSAM